MSDYPPSSLPYVTAPELEALVRRVTRLEAAVFQVQQAHAAQVPSINVSLEAPPVQGAAPPHANVAVAQPPAPNSAGPQAASPRTLPAAPVRSFDLLRGSEYWLNKIGIGLLLIGVAFLFKYSIDQGWLTPLIRVLFGGALGSGLVALGLTVRRARSHFGQVLQGGGVATLYMSTFAAFQLYDLLPYPAAFGAMLLVTTLAFALAVAQSAQLLAVLALLGGLATPFLLFTGAGGVSGLVGYTCLLVAGVAALYLVRGWSGLLATSFAGFYLILTLSASDLPARMRPTGDQWAVQAGVLFGALVFWILPVLRAIYRPSHKHAAPFVAEQQPRQASLKALILVVPLLSLGLSALTWTLADATWGFVTLAVAAVYALVAWTLQKRSRSGALAYTHGLAALLLVTVSGVLLLHGDVLFFALAAEAALLHALAARSHDRKVRDLGHLLFVIVGFWGSARLTGVRPEPAVLNATALAELCAITLALAASFVLKPGYVARVYWLALHFLLLAWLHQEIGRLPAQGGLVTVAWGVYGVALLVAGLRRDIQLLVVFGVGTLLLVLGKLFLVDLAEVEAIWRIMLFIGFGGAFLVLSYFFQALWRPRPQQATIGQNPSE